MGSTAAAPRRRLLATARRSPDPRATPRRRLLATPRAALEGLSPRHQRAAIVVAAAACGWLVPWSGWLAATLPPRDGKRRWALEWAALDLAEAGAAGSAAWLLERGDRRAAWAAATFAGLMVFDACVDVGTADSARARRLAVAAAVGVELPMAVAAADLAWRVLSARARRPRPRSGP